VHSAPGQGSVFTVELPAADSVTSDSGADAPTPGTNRVRSTAAPADPAAELDEPTPDAFNGLDHGPRPVRR
jgi:hypothetical protein